MIKRKVFFVFICILFLTLKGYAQANDVFGTWTTVDDQTGEHKATVEIYERDGKVYGKVVQITRESSRNNICDLCEGEDKDVPVIGMEFIKNLSFKNGKYQGGTITDPGNGKVYRSKIWIDPDNPNRLNLRGYILFFYRTQQWIRVE
ncbi:DUF2147 domain-containing protein [uncultured Dokdonia sp.]|uniref:DUF2147 domain-containing protein n=1 Tax=uncultured Dokdonia sp. TaxID=575653 RepID=UPI002615EFBF|nr:DUF2147 domain-containing protein [uncultured Dokdonia sp.]